MSDDDLDLDDMLSRIAESNSGDFWDSSMDLDDELDLTPAEGFDSDADLPAGDPLDPNVDHDFTLPDPGEERSGIHEDDSFFGESDDLLAASLSDPVESPPYEQEDPIDEKSATPPGDYVERVSDNADSVGGFPTDDALASLSEMASLNSTADDYPAFDLKEIPAIEDHSDDVDPDEMSAFIENEIISIRMASERQAMADDSESALAKQISTNARGRSIQNLPTGISMIEFNEDPPDPQVSRAGDEKRLKWMAITAACVVVSILASISVTLAVRPEVPAPTVAYGQGQNVGSGSVIDRNAAPAGAPGENTTGTTGSTGTDPVVPDGGSKVKYSVKAEGDITSASATYVDASGLPVQETGITLPWEITVGARASVTPNFAVAARGFGTLTCEVTSDGEVIAEKTSTGESPTVNCTG